MANITIALFHHGKAGHALKKHDLKLAAHHMGHALAALRTVTPAGTPGTVPVPKAPATKPPAVAGLEVAPSKPASSLRTRLTGMKPKQVPDYDD